MGRPGHNGPPTASQLPPPPPPPAPPPPCTTSGCASFTAEVLLLGLFMTATLFLVAASLRHAKRHRQRVQDERPTSPVDVMDPRYRLQHSQPRPLPPPPVPVPAQTLPSAEEQEHLHTLERARIAAVRELPTYKWAGGADNEECVMCLDPFADGETIKRLPCNHLFHAECIDRWLVRGMAHQKRACPLCKADPTGVVAPNKFSHNPGFLVPVTETLPPPPATPRNNRSPAPDENGGGDEGAAQASTASTPTLSARATRVIHVAAQTALSVMPWRSPSGGGGGGGGGGGRSASGRARRTIIAPEPQAPPPAAAAAAAPPAAAPAATAASSSTSSPPADEAVIELSAAAASESASAAAEPPRRGSSPRAPSPPAASLAWGSPPTASRPPRRAAGF